jgi:IclR family transcriptional regulator, acetate operon repressor
VLRRSVSTARVVQKAIDILFSLAAAPDGAGITDISRQLGLGKSTVHRLLKTVQQRQLVRQDATKRYRLNYGVLQLSSAFLRSLNIHERASWHLRRLRDVTGETASLTIREGTTRFHLEEVPGVHPIKYSLDIGKSLPLFLGASGKALVAWLDEDELDALIDVCGLPGFTPYSITDRGVLKEHLARTRKQGFAVSESERFLDAVSVAAPVRDHTGNIVAALNVTGPLHRFSVRVAREAGPVLVKEARDLSAFLGWPGDNEVIKQIVIRNHLLTASSRARKGTLARRDRRQRAHSVKILR